LGSQSQKTSETLTVKFYIDGDKNGEGVYAGTVVASNSGQNGGFAGAHTFYFDIPTQYNDASLRVLFIDATSNLKDYLIRGMPQEFSTYSYSIIGQIFYDTKLSSSISNSCSSCHGLSYKRVFNNLIKPSPNDEGSATNKELINMATGSHNGRVHPGVNICGEKMIFRVISSRLVGK
jgi:hypothetical protein